MKSIVCVSPNVSTDRVSVVDGFVPGETFRTIRSFDQAGGSATHAAGVITQHGGSAVAIGPIGQGAGERWMAAARRDDIPVTPVWMSEENRSSFVLVDEHLGKIAEVIDPGPKATRETVDNLRQTVHTALAEASLLVLSGSLPSGFPDDFYAELIQEARARSIACMVDSHSGPMAEAIRARPWAIKPNLDEFHQLVGRRTQTIDDRASLVRDLVETSADIVILSMAGDGVLLGTKDRVWHVTPPTTSSTLPGSAGQNPVGCGDALVGAFARTWVESGDVFEACRWGICAAHANLAHVEVPSAPMSEVVALLDEVQIEQVGRVSR